MRVNKKKEIIISSLGELRAYIQGIILISNGFIVHEIAYNGNLSMAYALIVFPWAEAETDGIRIRAILGWGWGGVGWGWERVEWRGDVDGYIWASFLSAMLLCPHYTPNHIGRGRKLRGRQACCLVYKPNLCSPKARRIISSGHIRS